MEQRNPQASSRYIEYTFSGQEKKLHYDSQSVYRPGEHLAQLEAEKRQRNNMPIDRQATKVSHIPQAPTLKFTWDKGFRSKEDEIDADVMPVFVSTQQKGEDNYRSLYFGD